MKNYDKPFKTYDEQIEILRSRNMIINDENFAKMVLSDLSYYTLINGYKKEFCESESIEKFKDMTSIEMVFILFSIENSLNSILLKYILLVEKSIKTKISYIIASSFGVNFYEDITIEDENYLYINKYANKNNRRINTLNKIIEEYQKTKNLAVLHYKEKKNHVPPWILFSALMFGQIVCLYKIFKDNEKKQVCSAILNKDLSCINDMDKEFVVKSLDLLVDYRNAFAHSKKTMRKAIKAELPKAQMLVLFGSNIVTDKDYNSGAAKNGLYALILVLLSFINNRFIANQFLIDISDLFKRYEKTDRYPDKTLYETLDLPEDIVEKMMDIIEIKNKQNISIDINKTTIKK